MARKKKKEPTVAGNSPEAKIQRIFQCEDLRELSVHIRERLNNFDVYDQYAEAFPLHSVDKTDYLQKVYEENQASKKGLAQCYTPADLSTVLSEMTQPEKNIVVLDVAAGSGALTLGAWRTNPDCFFIAQEYDMTVIPFLLFNMAIRNMNGIVVQSDALMTDLFTDPWEERYWLIQKGEKYSTILERKDMTREKMMDVLGDMFEKVTKDPSKGNLEQATVLTSLANCIEQMHVHQENQRQIEMTEKLYASASGK